MKKLFGTDGMRGKAGDFPLDEKTVAVAGKSLARIFGEKVGKRPRFVIGRDTRESGHWMEKAFCRGAVSETAVCESAGIITTPGLAFVTKQFGFDAGVVISASHNPFEDNGIKIFLPDGKKSDEATEREIENDILSGRWEIENGKFSVDRSKASEFQNAYLDHLAGSFPDLSLENFKIVIDCANGAASELAPGLFSRFGAEVISINNNPDGKNINRDCGSLHLEKLREKLLAEKADFGAAFDGDADRSLFVDEQGNLVDGDATLWIMAQYLQEHGLLKNNSVVATVMSNIGLEIALDSKKIKLLRTAVGDKYVLQELLRSDSSIGGEQSGHIIFPRKSLVGDGMMTTLYLLEAIREKKKKFSEMTAGFTRYPQILINVRVAEKRPFEDVEEIVSVSKNLESQLDGKGRLLLRYSGTENLARVMIEGENQTEIEAQAHRLAEVIKNSLG